MPRMIVIAGPPGGGKSTAFPASSFEVESFDADDRAAELNAGSYRAIPPEIRENVNAAFDAFIAEKIRTKRSFAFETTLRTNIKASSGVGKFSGKADLHSARFARVADFGAQEH